MNPLTLGWREPLRQLLEAAILLYSFAIIATILPESTFVPNTAVVLYYVLVPGYCISSVVRLEETTLGRAFFSVIWSLALLATASSLQSVTRSQGQIPMSLIVPAVAIVFLVYGHFHRGTRR